MSDKLSIAHISDVHLSPVRGLWPNQWTIKRLLGYANWIRRRSKVHRHAVVDQLVNDISAHRLDHVVVTGDLVNLGLPAEIDAAAQWLGSLGPPERITAIPGNHDVYSHVANSLGIAPWAKNMSSNQEGADLIKRAGAQSASVADTNSSALIFSPPAFPFCRVQGPFALIGLNSAIPTKPFDASGQLGDEQRAALAKTLNQARHDGLVRVILIHHPPLPGQAPPKRALRDADALKSLLEATGAELILHGHNHRDSIAWCRGPNVSIPVLGVASGSAAIKIDEEPRARYNIVHLTRIASTVRIDVSTRGQKRSDGPLSDIALQSFQVRTG